MRSTRSIEILCLVLAALVLVWSRALLNQLWPVLSLLGTFAIAIVVFRSRRFFPRRTRTRLLIESWSMVIFITGVLWFTGKSSSPLLNFYLLPIILSALTLGRLVTLLQEWSPAIPGLCLYYPGHRHVPPPLRAFIAELRSTEHRQEMTKRVSPCSGLPSERQSRP